MPQRLLTTTAAGLAMLASPLASAQDDTPLVDVRYAGLAEIEPTAKDADAHRALMSLGSRLRLLPREIPDFDADRKWLDAGWRVLTGGGGMSLWAGDDAPVVSLSLIPNGGTEGMLDTIQQFLLESAGPEEFTVNEDGSLRLDSPGGWIHVGDTMTEGKQAIAVQFGEGPVAPVVPERFDLPAGVEPVLSMSLEIGRMLDMLAEFIEEDDPRAFDQIDRFGFLDAGAARAEFAMGAEGDAGFMAGRLTDAKPWIGRFFGDGAFESADFRGVPQDATVVMATSADFAWTLEVIEAISEETGRDFVEQIREGFGIDLDSGLLSNIGPRWIVYLSDTTGGGGYLSVVVMAELRDPDAFAQSHASALVHANQFGSALGRGYARTREWQLAGNTAWSAVFPGLPVPVEPSWTVADGWLIAAATPVGLASAVAQLESDASVLDNPLFQQAVTDHWPGNPVTQVSFVDTARYATKGYSSASLAASALANAVRQPFNVAAEPGTIMPAFHEFADGIRPTGSITTWDGDDLVQRTSADSSALVQIAAAAGQSSGWQSMYFPAMSAGVLLPALGNARQSAQHLKSATQVRGVVQGAIILHQDDPDGPITADRLVEIGAITEEMLESPTGEPWDAGPAIVLREQFGEFSIGDFDPDLVVAMDRAMYVNWEDVVNLGFADGRVETLQHWEVDEYLAMPKNAGLREEWSLD